MKGVQLKSQTISNGGLTHNSITHPPSPRQKKYKKNLVNATHRINDSPDDRAYDHRRSNTDDNHLVPLTATFVACSLWSSLQSRI
ncbi:hypothetical protein vseg_018181 [Gypsophila vaccaria]